jgi:AcrR family transcriptional regulator
MPKPTFDNLPQDKRQRVIEAAIDEFSSQPYAKATLDRIVEAAGISKGSMYQYFSGKADLYRWLMTAYLPERKMAAIGAEAPPSDASIWAVLEQAFLSGVKFTAAEPGLTRLGVRFMRDHELEPDLVEVSRQNRQAADAYLTGLLKAARDRGELRADVEIPAASGFLAHALGEGMLDLLARRLGISLEDLLDQPDAVQSLTTKELRDVVRSVTRLFREGVGATPPTEEAP